MSTRRNLRAMTREAEQAAPGAALLRLQLLVQLPGGLLLLIAP